MATSLKNPAGKTPLAQQKKNSFNLWEIRNGGGGWVHPFHLHMEEHRTVMRNGKDVTKGDPAHPDDVSREDLVALDPGESVIIYRGFRDFIGPYVAHCHNLAHEDHAMMFGWEITPMSDRRRVEPVTAPASTSPPRGAPSRAPAGVPWRTVLPLAVRAGLRRRVLDHLAARRRRRHRAHPEPVRRAGCASPPLSLPLFVLAVLGALTLAHALVRAVGAPAAAGRC